MTQPDELQQLAQHARAHADDYDAHVAWITAADEQGELDSLREARRTMAQRFPVAEPLWLAWFDTEAELGTPHAELLQLAQQALQDYATVPLGVRALTYAFAACEDGALTAAARDAVVQDVLSLVGHDVPHAGDAYDAAASRYRALGVAQHAEQLLRVYHAQVSTPHEGLAKGMHDLRKLQHELDGKDVSAELEEAYNGATQALMQRHALERAVRNAASPGDLVAAWQRYAAYEREHGTQAQIDRIYERAVTASCLSVDLWRDYACNSSRLPLPQRYQRALRNVPWSGELHASLLRCQEEEPSLVQVQRAVASVQDDVTQPVQALIERAHMIAITPDSITRWRAMLHEAMQLVPAAYQVPLHRVCAHWELYVARDVAACRAEFEHVLEAWGSAPAVWYERLELEHAACGAFDVPDEQVMRAVLRRAVKHVSGDPSDLEYRWLAWERSMALRTGSLTNVQAAHDSIARRAASRAARAATRHGAERSGGDSRKRARDPDDAAGSRKRARRDPADAGTARASTGKARAVEDQDATMSEDGGASDQQQPQQGNKLVRKVEEATNVPGATLYVTGLGAKARAETDEVRAIAEQHGTVTGIRVLRGYAFITYASAAEAKAAAPKLTGIEFHGKRVRATIATERSSVRVHGAPKPPSMPHATPALQPGTHASPTAPKQRIGALVPRAARLKAGPRSNADFRAMLPGLAHKASDADGTGQNNGHA